jgi:DNA polymerase II large subunit
VTRNRSLAEQIERIQGRLKHIEQLLRSAHKFDTRAIATMAQVAGIFELVSAEIMELNVAWRTRANAALKRKTSQRKKK